MDESAANDARASRLPRTHHLRAAALVHDDDDFLRGDARRHRVVCGVVRALLLARGASEDVSEEPHRRRSSGTWLTNKLRRGAECAARAAATTRRVRSTRPRDLPRDARATAKRGRGIASTRDLRAREVNALVVGSRGLLVAAVAPAATGSRDLGGAKLQFLFLLSISPYVAFKECSS